MTDTWRLTTFRLLAIILAVRDIAAVIGLTPQSPTAHLAQVTVPFRRTRLDLIHTPSGQCWLFLCQRSS